MQYDFTSKVTKLKIQVRSNSKKITKLQYYGVKLFSYIFHFHDFLSYEILKHNTRIYNLQSNVCRICNNFRTYKIRKKFLLPFICLRF